MTARGVALLRAAHRIIDDPPLLLDDSIIARMLGADTAQRVRDRVEQLETPVMRGLRSHVLLRSRFAEDSLAQAVAAGFRQYIILGAGLDTFAYRQPSWASLLTIVEVDQPASQTDKRAALAAAGVSVPSNVRYPDIDFERETLASGLERCGVAMDTPSFFSWLGVTMYLTRDAIEAVLRTVASFPSGSTIVLTFAPPRAEGDRARSELAEGAGGCWRAVVELFRSRGDRGAASRRGFLERRISRTRGGHASLLCRAPHGLVAPRPVSIVTAAR